MGFSKNQAIFLNSLLTILTTLIVTLFILNRLILEGIGVCIIGILCIIWFNIWQLRNRTVIDSSHWIYFNRLMERWGKDGRELHQMILNTELLRKRYIDHTDYASSQATPNIISVEKINTEFDITDNRLCFKLKDIEEFEKKHRKVFAT